MYNVWVSSVPSWTVRACATNPVYTFTPQPVLTEKRWLPDGREPSWKRGIWT